MDITHTASCSVRGDCAQVSNRLKQFDREIQQIRQKTFKRSAAEWELTLEDLTVRQAEPCWYYLHKTCPRPRKGSWRHVKRWWGEMRNPQRTRAERCRALGCNLLAAPLMLIGTTTNVGFAHVNFVDLLIGWPLSRLYYSSRKKEWVINTLRRDETKHELSKLNRFLLDTIFTTKELQGHKRRHRFKVINPALLEHHTALAQECRAVLKNLTSRQGECWAFAHDLNTQDSSYRSIEHTLSCLEKGAAYSKKIP